MNRTLSFTKMSDKRGNQRDAAFAKYYAECEYFELASEQIARYSHSSEHWFRKLFDVVRERVVEKYPEYSNEMVNFLTRIEMRSEKLMETTPKCDAMNNIEYDVEEIATRTKLVREYLSAIEPIFAPEQAQFFNENFVANRFETPTSVRKSHACYMCSQRMTGDTYCATGDSHTDLCKGCVDQIHTLPHKLLRNMHVHGKYLFPHLRQPDSNICKVCHEVMTPETYSRTKCGHEVCMVCMEDIREDMPLAQRHIMCPVCHGKC